MSKQALGGRRRADALTPAERSEIARAGAAATNSPEGKARSIVKAWEGLPPERRRAVLDILREGGVLGGTVPMPLGARDGDVIRGGGPAGSRITPTM